MRVFLAQILCLILAALAGASDNGKTWIAPPARMQLAQDPHLIPKGKGLLFVPTMTTPRNEPSYQVWKDDKEVSSANPGTGVVLSPGLYRVLIGSGTILQMMSKTVEIREGYTTLLKPDWAGLVIDVIDENRTSLNESYELFDEDKLENYGTGFGVEEERGERVRTWLLKPGVYTVVSVGEDISSTRKFSVQLLPGKLTQRNLVLDADNNRFVGFYPSTLQLGGGGHVSKNLRTQWELSGSTLFDTSQRSAGQDRPRVSLSFQVHNRTRYNTEKHFASLRLITEEGITKEGSDSFRKSVDEFELRATYIYRLSPRIGPYLRSVFNTTLFATDVRFDDPRDFALLSAGGDTLKTLSNTREITLEPAFFPLRLRQGIGINSPVFRTFRFNMDLRFGLGARQTYVSDTFKLNADNQSATRLESVTSTGFEALLVTDSRLTPSINLTSEFDLLIPSRKVDSWVFSWENRWRIFLSSFINLDIVADLEREETLQRVQARQQVLLRISKFL